MIAFKKYVTIKDSRQLTLSDLPFQPGQLVEVVILGAESAATNTPASELRALFKVTQSLPQAKSISEAEIAAEIAAYREGR